MATLRSRVGQGNYESVFVLVVISIAIIQGLFILLNQILGTEVIKLGQLFFLLIAALAIILPYAIIMGGMRLDVGKAVLVVVVLGLDVVFFKYIAPKLLPVAFSLI